MDFYAMLADFWDIVFQRMQSVPKLNLPEITGHDLSVVGVTLLAVAGINLIYLLSGKRKRRRAGMTKEERRLYERRMVSDAITDGIEDLVYRDKISRNTATHWYFLIGHRCGLTDLFPKPPAKPAPPPADELKMAIRERLVNLWKTKKPLPAPVEKPKEGKVFVFQRRPLKSA